MTDPDLNRKEFTDRLREAVGGESARSFARRARISTTAMNHYLAGRNEPTRPVLITIAFTAGVSLEWLITGNGPMRHDPASPGALDPAAKLEEPPAPSYVPELLETVVMAIEYGAQMTGRTLTPEQRAQLTVNLYSVMERRSRMRMEGDNPTDMLAWMASRDMAKDLAEAMRTLDDIPPTAQAAQSSP